MNHPIESLMETAMNNIQDMIDVNTIIGEPIEIGVEIAIIPISKVSFGFAAGGSEFNAKTKEKKKEEEEIRLPFGRRVRSRSSNKPNSIFSYSKRKCKTIANKP